MEDIVGVSLALTIGPCMIVAVFWVVFSTFRRLKIARMQTEIHSRLLEKIGSSQEFLTYLDTEPGKRLIASIALEQRRPDPYSRILRSVQAGVILVLVGLAFLLLGRHFVNIAEGFLILGTLGIALGLGFLISAGLSYRLSKAFGLFDRAQAIERQAA